MTETALSPLHQSRLRMLNQMTSWADLGVTPDPLDRVSGQRMLPLIMADLREIQRSQPVQGEYVKALLTDCGWLTMGVKPSQESTQRMRKLIDRLTNSTMTHVEQQGLSEETPGYEEDDVNDLPRPSPKG